jgi:hypothetical protein
LDAVVILSRPIASRGFYPPVDALMSSASTLKKTIVGIDHYEAATKAIEMLQNYQRISRIVAIVGEAELSPYDQLVYQRAKKLVNYMTQPFFTTQSQTGKKGVTVTREQTIRDVQMIITGKLDAVPAEKFLYIGSIEEANLLPKNPSKDKSSDDKKSEDLPVPTNITASEKKTTNPTNIITPTSNQTTLPNSNIAEQNKPIPPNTNTINLNQTIPANTSTSNVNTSTTSNRKN